jgi:hypothetical protein
MDLGKVREAAATIRAHIAERLTGSAEHAFERGRPMTYP